jgi:putative NADPH-quinone reductase
MSLAKDTDMIRKILIIQGHPNPDGNRYCHALAESYINGATSAGHQVRHIDVARLDFPVLRTKSDFENQAPNAAVQEAQDSLKWSDHVVIVHPLWLGSQPALLKAFLEQVFRPGFAFRATGTDSRVKLLNGHSVRIVITMGMPVIFYRWYFGAHGLKSLEQCVLRFCGMGPISETLIGGIDTMDKDTARAWIDQLAGLGRDGA